MYMSAFLSRLLFAGKNSNFAVFNASENQQKNLENTTEIAKEASSLRDKMGTTVLGVLLVVHIFPLPAPQFPFSASLKQEGAALRSFLLVTDQGEI